MTREQLEDRLRPALAKLSNDERDALLLKLAGEVLAQVGESLVADLAVDRLREAQEAVLDGLRADQAAALDAPDPVVPPMTSCGEQRSQAETAETLFEQLDPKTAAVH